MEAMQESRPALVGADGSRIELPQPVHQLLVNLLRELQQGRAVVLLPEDETFTTAAAASFLGVSRQHLVDLLDRNEIPHHRVGAHRRVTLGDLRLYQQVRDKKRHEALDNLQKRIAEAGFDDASHTGDAS
jgi:excisionase family DNA binding protein